MIRNWLEQIRACASSGEDNINTHRHLMLQDHRVSSPGLHQANIPSGRLTVHQTIQGDKGPKWSRATKAPNNLGRHRPKTTQGDTGPKQPRVTQAQNDPRQLKFKTIQGDADPTHLHQGGYSFAWRRAYIRTEVGIHPQWGGYPFTPWQASHPYYVGRTNSLFHGKFVPTLIELWTYLAQCQAKLDP